MLHNCTDERRVVVLPAFETASLLSMAGGRGMASRAAAGSKQALQELYRAGSVTPFGVAGHVNYAPGHAATEYPRQVLHITSRLQQAHALSSFSLLHSFGIS